MSWRRGRLLVCISIKPSTLTTVPCPASIPDAQFVVSRSFALDLAASMDQVEGSSLLSL